MDEIFNLKNIIVFPFLLILIVTSIAFLFIKKNELFGLKIYDSVNTEKTWHKVHVIAAICNIPFIICYIVLLLVPNVLVKIIVSMILLVCLIISWTVIPNVATKKERIEQYEIERKKVEDENKKEPSWIK